MRPARKGPENLNRYIYGHPAMLRFNEAGPQGAGKPAVRASIASGCSFSFNEAGPQGAGKLEVVGLPAVAAFASMRPARKGPENAPDGPNRSINCYLLQ